MATWPTVISLPLPVSSGTWAIWDGVWIGWMLATSSRCSGVSVKPSAPTAEPVVKPSSPASTELAAVAISSSSVIPCVRIRAGSPSTMICRGLTPQIAAFATPGTPISLGRIVHCATVDSSSGDSVVEVKPICMTRLVAETIGYICGGSHHVGSVGAVVRSRSWTSCLACSWLVPDRKYR